MRAERNDDGKKFCTTCRSRQPEEGGEWVVTGRTRRWRCGGCKDKAAARQATKQPGGLHGQV